MSGVGTSALALRVEAAKRLLRELEAQAETALAALGRDDGDEFLAAVEGREHILEQLDHVVEAVARQRSGVRGDDTETGQLMAEIARAAAVALESHENLVAKTRRERDRVAVVLNPGARRDMVASQYALAAMSARPLTISVTG